MQQPRSEDFNLETVTNTQAKGRQSPSYRPEDTECLQVPEPACKGTRTGPEETKHTHAYKPSSTGGTDPLSPYPMVDLFQWKSPVYSSAHAHIVIEWKETHVAWTN